MSTHTKFEWPRLHKVEERIEYEINEISLDHVKNFYSVDDITDLTEEQIEAILDFANNEMWDSSPFKIGLINIHNDWEDANTPHICFED